MAIGALAVVAAAIATRRANVAAANREYQALLQRLRVANRTAGLPIGTISTVEEAAALNAAFELNLVEMDRQIAESVAKLRLAQEAARPKPITIEVIGGSNSGN